MPPPGMTLTMATLHASMPTVGATLISSVAATLSASTNAMVDSIMTQWLPHLQPPQQPPPHPAVSAAPRTRALHHRWPTYQSDHMNHDCTLIPYNMGFLLRCYCDHLLNIREERRIYLTLVQKPNHIFSSELRYVAAPPNPHLASFRAFKKWKASVQFIDADDKEQPEEDNSDVPLILRRPERVTGKSKSNEKWNTQRLCTRVRPSSSGGETPDEYVDTPTTDPENLFIQGQCEKVAFRVDNFRPREGIFDERYFLDSEPSGNEEW
ncbi:hypothetical protein GQ43DRAFT_466494 [Delitschia confertaspora ATCC 74209]|uniref:Pyridoxamine 5'-phosphate oxidase Alr4036 family FMN-binding domain-containing protein n=1 Tax=Delitschia confertaspora ATCC 74209 TaxID=1513339 RepID=A0A9P4JDP3_9PLEO|nr:hypothetical protein GQ43DRAFT_466494 [Delitschia confertaspora ATCC 74209]